MALPADFTRRVQNELNVERLDGNVKKGVEAAVCFSGFLDECWDMGSKAVADGVTNFVIPQDDLKKGSAGKSLTEAAKKTVTEMSEYYGLNDLLGSKSQWKPNEQLRISIKFRGEVRTFDICHPMASEPQKTSASPVQIANLIPQDSSSLTQNLVAAVSEGQLQIYQPEETSPVLETAKAYSSALFNAVSEGAAGLFLQFGGQGANYVKELRYLYNSEPESKVFIDTVNAALVAEAACSEAQSVSMHGDGIDVVSWIQDESKCPAPAYLNSAAVSYPLIGLTQLAQYKNTLHKCGMNQAQMSQLVKGATGHSQGVVAAAAVASAIDDADLVQKAQDVAKYLFWHGTRMQVETQTQQAASTSDVKTGAATPLLAVIGLNVATVRQFVAAVNRKIEREPERLAVALVNGSNVCVVGGHPALLSKFAVLLQKSNSTQGKDHSKVPFYKRKPRVTLRWVPVNAPFHCPQMAAAVPCIMEDVARLGLRIRGEDLKFPVYATSNGENLQDQDDIMKALVEMQCTQMVDFPACLAKVTRANGVTHVLDFGPGGASGSAQLAARILEQEGRGVLTVLAVTSKMEDEPATINRPEMLGMGELLKEEAKDLRTIAPTAAPGAFWPTLDTLTVSLNGQAYQGPFPTNCNIVVTDM